MIVNRTVALTADCVFTDRPGEGEMFIEGARLAERCGRRIDMLTMPSVLMAEIERSLAENPDGEVYGLLDVSEEHILYVLVQPRGCWPAYTDGKSFYDTRTLLEVKANPRHSLPRAA